MRLLKYFASKSSDLKAYEIEILKGKPIWPKKSLVDNEPEEIHFVARDLHTPTPLHCEFGLPVISWNKGWSNSSEEGMFIVFLYYLFNFVKLFIIKRFYRKIFNQVGFARISYT